MEPAAVFMKPAAIACCKGDHLYDEGQGQGRSPQMFALKIS
jgi:hypothetical protein